MLTSITATPTVLRVLANERPLLSRGLMTSTLICAVIHDSVKSVARESGYDLYYYDEPSSFRREIRCLDKKQEDYNSILLFRIPLCYITRSRLNSDLQPRLRMTQLPFLVANDSTKGIA